MTESLSALTAPGFEGLLAMMTEIRTKLDMQAREIIDLRVAWAGVLGELKTQVSSLHELLKDGPKGTLIARVAVLEQQVDDLRTEREARDEEESEENIQGKSFRWQAYLAVALAVASFIGSLVCTMIALAHSK